MKALARIFVIALLMAGLSLSAHAQQVSEDTELTVTRFNEGMERAEIDIAIPASRSEAMGLATLKYLGEQGYTYMGLAQSEVSEVGAPTIMFAKVEKKRLPYLWVSVILMDRLRGPEDGSVTYRYRGYLLYNNPEQPIIPSEAFQRSFYEAEVARILGRFSTYTGN